ncbi:MAG: VOC family protein [Thermohalobaculum sp.]|nr:VOC family protein [Thermohalobaculum sp.]
MAHRSRLAGLIIDCQAPDPRAATRFWAAALGSGAAPEGEPETARYWRLDPQGGLHVEVQAVDHPSRVHLDIESDDIPAEVARLEALGARVIDRISTWVVMEAPTGHRFCVIRSQTADFDARATTWED